MIEYLPWSNKELIKTIEEYRNGHLSILDIELGGTCNFNCLYCDSPDRHKDFQVDLDRVKSEMEDRKIRWIYICGLGEPTYGKNVEVLLELLALAKTYDAKCSIFTNLSNIPDKFIEYIDKGVLCLLFKADSLNSLHASKIYGTGETDIQVLNIKRIVEHVHIVDGCTNLAASIVPTQENINEIPGIVQWCIDHNVYPLIAELENAGDGADVFQRLDPGKMNLAKLKWDLLIQQCDNIKVPICPAMIGGVHVNYKGIVTVDEKTGFSCHWFWLDNPVVKPIGDFSTLSNWEDYENNIIGYRKSRVDHIKGYIENSPKGVFVFGGCGGSVEDILLSHLALHVDRDRS